MIIFSRPVVIGDELKYINEAARKRQFSGDHAFTKLCSDWLEKTTGVKAFLTTSCSHALEMAAMLLNVREGDEVIMPSFTFPSTANAFILRGAKVVFVDIRADTMNIDENLIEDAVTERTRAIVPVHYAGVGCEMDTIMDIAAGSNIPVVEDAAQAVLATYKGRMLGSIGDIGTYSFHESKNIHCGEGGSILLRDASLVARAEIIREKGTNRASFYREEVSKYSWQDIGSSFLPSELNAAFLYAQFEKADIITDQRLRLWNSYRTNLEALSEKGFIELPGVPDECAHNGHIFYIKARDLDERSRLIQYLRENDVYAVFHYIPLHSSAAGLKYSRFHGEDRFTTKESERLVRLPLFHEMTPKDVETICAKIEGFYSKGS